MKKKYISIGFLFVLLLSLNCFAQAKFTYPINPNKKGWLDYRTASDRRNALQIPDNLIDSIPTDELLSICLDHPYLSDILFYDNMQEGLEDFKNKFNGFEALLQRNDVAEVLLAADSAFFSGFETRSPMSIQEKGDCSVKNLALELMLIQDNILWQFSYNELQRLYEVMQNNNSLKSYYLNGFEMINEVPFKTLNTREIIRASVPRSMFNTTSDYTPTTIYTPNGSVVPNAYLFVGYDIVPGSSEYIYIMSYVSQNYPNATIVGQPTYTYNSHGYAWHVSEGGNQVKISREVGNDFIYWQDSSYVEVPEIEAKKIAYTNSANHSAIKVDSIWYQSKWGHGPLVKHLPDDCPYGSRDTKKYYIDFILISSGISGSTFPCGSEVYSVPVIPNNCTVSWEWESSVYNHSSNTNTSDDEFENDRGVPDTIEIGDSLIHWPVVPGPTVYTTYITQDSPEPNQCTVTLPSGTYLNNNLVATIKNNGNTIRRLSKTLRTGANFSGTYVQAPKQYSGWYYQGTEVMPFHDGSDITLYKGSTITLVSSDFIGATVTYSGGTPMNWTHNGNTITFQVRYFAPFSPRSNNEMNNISTDPVTLTIKGVNGCEVYKFRITCVEPPTYNNASALSMNVSGNGSDFQFSIVSANENDMKITDNMYVWTLNIINSMTGKTVYSDIVNGKSAHVDVSNWEPGIYIANVNAGNRSLTHKIVVSNNKKR